MTKKNETIVLLLSLLITGAAIAGGAFWFSQKREFNPSERVEVVPGSANVSVEDRISGGEQILLLQPKTQEKEAGVKALAQENYQDAIAQFEIVLQTHRNDPEALIYLNNARIGREKSYTIVASVPIGADIDTAKEMLRGVAQAQNETNLAGGIGGVPLKVLIANDDDSPDIVRTLAKAFVRRSEILGVVGHFSSDTTLAAAEIYQAEGLVVISPTSTSVELSGQGSYIFRTVPSDRFAGSALARYQLQTLKKQKAAVFFNTQSNYSRSLKEVFSTDLFGEGGEVVAEFDFSKPGFNAAEAVKTAISQDAEVLMLATNSGEILDLALQVIQVNDRRLSLLGGDSAYAPKTLQIGRSDAVGMVLAVPWHSLGNPDSTFPQAAYQLWGGEVNWRTALAYDAAQSLIAAISLEPTRSGLQQVLSSINFKTEGASGDIRFFPSGDRKQAVQLVTIQPGERTNFDYEFVPIP